MDLQLIKLFCASLPKPHKDDSKLAQHVSTILRRSLRQQHLADNQFDYPVPSLIICITAFLTKFSLQQLSLIFNKLVSDQTNQKWCVVSLDDIQRVNQNGWLPAARNLGLTSKSEANAVEGHNCHIEQGFLSGYTFIFIPNIFFPDSAAAILLHRVKEHGAKGHISDPGISSFQKALKINKSHNTVIICADISLLRETPNSTQPHRPLLRSQRWLADSLRDKRMRLSEPYLRDAPNANDIKKQEPESATKKRSLEEFRAENPLPKTPSQQKKRKTLKNSTLGPSPTRIQFTAEQHGEGDNREEIDEREIVEKQDIVSVHCPPRVRWACEVRTTSHLSDFPMNDRICELLGLVKEAYVVQKDQFHATGYERAIAKIRNLQYEILTVDDARALTNEKAIGERMVLKIEEIVKTGNLRQADAVLSNGDINAIKTLCDVWGIGPVKALTLTSRGITSIEHLRKAIKQDSSLLDKNQKIGLKYYEDLLYRIPREHIAELEMYIRRVVKRIDERLEITIAGSYLRGKKDCGDIDVLIHGDMERVRNGFGKIKQQMRKDRVITDDLVDGSGKYFGVFKLPGRKHGRLDLFAVPNEKYPYALLTYTGSAIFNRSMRAKARALGYTLSHDRLQRIVRKRHEKQVVEPPIIVKNEKEIFFLLDIPYCPPESRSV